MDFFKLLCYSDFVSLSLYEFHGERMRRYEKQNKKILQQNTLFRVSRPHDRIDRLCFCTV